MQGGGSVRVESGGGGTGGGPRMAGSTHEGERAAEGAAGEGRSASEHGSIADQLACVDGEVGRKKLCSARACVRDEIPTTNCGAGGLRRFPGRVTTPPGYFRDKSGFGKEETGSVPMRRN